MQKSKFIKLFRLFLIAIICAVVTYLLILTVITFFKVKDINSTRSWDNSTSLAIHRL